MQLTLDLIPSMESKDFLPESIGDETRPLSPVLFILLRCSVGCTAASSCTLQWQTGSRVVVTWLNEDDSSDVIGRNVIIMTAVDRETETILNLV